MITRLSTHHLRHGVSYILVCNDTPDQLDRASRCGSNAWLTRPVFQERCIYLQVHHGHFSILGNYGLYVFISRWKSSAARSAAPTAIAPAIFRM